MPGGAHRPTHTSPALSPSCRVLSARPARTLVQSPLAAWHHDGEEKRRHRNRPRPMGATTQDPRQQPTGRTGQAQTRENAPCSPALSTLMPGPISPPSKDSGTKPPSGMTPRWRGKRRHRNRPRPMGATTQDPRQQPTGRTGRAQTRENAPCNKYFQKLPKPSSKTSCRGFCCHGLSQYVRTRYGAGIGEMSSPTGAKSQSNTTGINEAAPA